MNKIINSIKGIFGSRQVAQTKPTAAEFFDAKGAEWYKIMRDSVASANKSQRKVVRG